MPGFNRKGPEGMGSTGGGRGLCNSANRSFNRGAGAGRGRGLGNGRLQPGMGRRAGFGYAGSSYNDRVREESILRNEETMLKDELKAIKQKLDKIKETT